MMLRLIGGIVAGLVIWMTAVTVLNLGLRHGLPGYAAVEATMTFTLPMMIARLAISAVASIAGGYGAAVVAGRPRAATIAGIVLLIVFLPVHYGLFDKFPLWYHLTFLASLPLLSIAGGALAARRQETV
jgi:hypothetical protein